VARANAARLNADGSLDPGFDAGSGAVINSVNAIAVDASDNSYIAGFFSTFNGITRNSLVKLGPNGAIDLTFDPGAGTNFQISAIAPPTATAGPVIGGSFTSYNGASANRIARVNATTGALDTAFTTAGGTGFNGAVRAINLRASGQYYVGGTFTTYGTTARGRIASLNSDGSLDTGFVPTPGLTRTVRCLVGYNAKQYAGGTFISPVNQLARYSSSGVRDTTLNAGTGIGSSDLATVILPIELDALAVQPDGKLLIGGVFSSYQGVTRYAIARLSNSHLRITAIAPFSGHLKISGVGDPATTYSFQASLDPNASNFSEIAMVATDGNGDWSYEDLSSPMSFTKRFYRAGFY
jgi:uncharacterized delta-60 repeat protein